MARECSGTTECSNAGSDDSNINNDSISERRCYLPLPLPLPWSAMRVYRISRLVVGPCASGEIYRDDMQGSKRQKYLLQCSEPETLKLCMLSGTVDAHVLLHLDVYSYIHVDNACQFCISLSCPNHDLIGHPTSTKYSGTQ